ncbi:hypothetical protein RhiirC2_872056 [Rhizophagus irregularis]|uniref:Uncharacterized protein n=1 Tax=Rhizophagus irregularis TaxID=588596 RepID=A0A2N1M3W7_9GLOM|nr:hypothetical protein RhiirC2_872056 [Rhizophagus irregularis]
MAKKRITDKHIKYIFNHVIIPRIEYRSQVTIFTDKETNQMMVPIRRLFKNKLKFSKSAPNTILESNLIYNLRSIHDNQVQAKITNFFIQINDIGILGEIMNLRLIDIQNQLWSHENPVIHIPFKLEKNIKKLKKLKNNFILNNLLLMEKNNISIKKDNIQIEKNKKIIGEGKTIAEIVGETIFFKHRKFLRSLNLLYIDQVLDMDGKTLLTWCQLYSRKFIQNTVSGNQHIQPAIYNIIKEIICEENSLSLKSQFIQQPVTSHLKGFNLMPIIFPNIEQYQIVMYKEGSSLAFGRFLNINEVNQQIKIQHLVRKSDVNEKNLILEFCKGCNRGIFSSSLSKPICYLSISSHNVFFIRHNSLKRNSFKEGLTCLARLALGVL